METISKFCFVVFIVFATCPCEIATRPTNESVAESSSTGEESTVECVTTGDPEGSTDEVLGEYSVRDPEGRERKVQYIRFRAWSEAQFCPPCKATCPCEIVTQPTSESVTEGSSTGEESTVESVTTEGSTVVMNTEAASTEEAIEESTEGPTAESTEEASEAFSCEGKEDGIYDLGCSSTFCSCLNGAPTYLHCSAGLKYDSISRHCLDPDYVAACGGTTTEVPSEGAGETSTEAATSEEVSTAEESPAPEEATSEAPELEVTEVTEEKETEDGQSESTQESSELSTAGLKTTEEIFETFTCEGKPDGVYDLGCSSTFCSCLGGQPTFMHCPAGLKYDVKSSRCLPGADVAACGSTATEPSTTSLAELETTKEQAEAAWEEPLTEAVSKEASTEAASEEASTEAFSEESSTEAVSEESSTEGASEEASTEAFSEESSTEAVSEEASAEAASGKTSTEGASEEASTEAVSEETSTEVAFSEEVSTDEEASEVSSEEAATTEASFPPFSCNGRLDSVYGLGCSETFCSCLDGIATCLSCPTGLKYDEISGRCLHADYVAACGGVSTESLTTSGNPTEQAVSVEQTTSGVSEEETTGGVSEATEEQTLGTEGEPTETGASEAPSTQEVSSTTAVPKGQPCYGLHHGVYCDGCSSKYLVCLKQFKGWHQCPWPLKYDVNRYRCALPKTIQACSPVYQAAPSGPTVPDAGAP